MAAWSVPGYAEAGLLRSIAVPHVVRMLGYAEEPGHGAAIIMELVNGASLHATVEQAGATAERVATGAPAERAGATGAPAAVAGAPPAGALAEAAMVAEPGAAGALRSSRLPSPP
jgi:hypothetical protein